MVSGVFLLAPLPGGTRHRREAVPARLSFPKEGIMTSKQARDFIAKYSNAKSFVKPSHLEELSPLLEVHVEAIEVRKDEFHDISGAFMPRKETLDKFAQAAGVSYNPTAETTRKEGEGCYVGTAQAKVLGPDGKELLGPVCEYEFDVSVRLEELKLKGKADWDHKDSNGRPGTRQYTEIELGAERIQLMKVGRMRANTGARNRATLAVLGMQTGFKGLFGKNENDGTTRTFLFSRVIWNAKNEMVLNRMLDTLAAPQSALYGPAPARAIAAPESEPRNVTPAPAGDNFPDVPFDGPAAVPAVDPKVEELIARLGEWAIGDNKAVANVAQCVIDSGESRPKVLESALSLLSYLSTGNPRGARQCADALVMSPLDPVILADLVKKIGPAKGAAA